MLAFAIDAAWEQRLDSEAEAHLVKSLILDFETTQLRLRDSIGFGQSLLDSNEEFFLIVSSQEKISAERYGDLVNSFFRGIPFEPALSAYESAVGPSGLNTIQSVEFLQAVASFFESKTIYDFHIRISGELFYQGSTLKIRRELGSLGVIYGNAQACQGFSCTYPDNFTKGVDELLEFVKRPDIYADLENISNANTGIVNSLRGMEAATENALEALRSID